MIVLDPQQLAKTKSTSLEVPEEWEDNRREITGKENHDIASRLLCHCHHHLLDKRGWSGRFQGKEKEEGEMETEQENPVGPLASLSFHFQRENSFPVITSLLVFSRFLARLDLVFFSFLNFVFRIINQRIWSLSSTDFSSN